MQIPHHNEELKKIITTSVEQKYNNTMGLRVIILRAWNVHLLDAIYKTRKTQR